MPPAASRSVPIATVAYKEEKLLYRICVLVRPLWVHRCRGVRGRIGTVYCAARERLDIGFLNASAPSKQTPSFLTLNAETGFLQFKEPGPFKLTLRHRRLYAELRRSNDTENFKSITIIYPSTTVYKWFAHDSSISTIIYSVSLPINLFYISTTVYNCTGQYKIFVKFNFPSTNLRNIMLKFLLSLTS